MGFLIHAVLLSLALGAAGGAGPVPPASNVQDTSRAGYEGEAVYGVGAGDADAAEGDAARAGAGDTARGGSADSAAARAASGPGDPAAGADPLPDTSGALELEGKSVKAAGTKVHRQKQVSRIRLTRSDMQKVVAAQGDPLKALGTLPGVVNQNDLSVRPFVRGGKAEETQILWDGVALLQPYHFGTLYSVFNTESLSDMTLYSGGFPVEAGNALSAAILMRSRPPDADSLRLFGDLSMLRGTAYASVPLIERRLAVSVSWQSFWYDWVLNRAWDLADWAASDDDFSANKNEFRRLVEFPNFRDFQIGLAWKINARMDADYVGLLSDDFFHARDPSRSYFHRDREVSPQWYNQHAYASDAGKGWEMRQGLDTVANVAVDNQIHAANFRWRPTSALEVSQTFAYQRQDWHVQFSDEKIWHDSTDAAGNYAGYRTYGPSVERMKLAKQAFDWNLDSKWDPLPGHLLRFGASQSARSFEYDTRLIRPVFESIVNGSVDITEGMSFMYPDGLVLYGDDSSLYRHADFLTSLPSLLRFDYSGESRGSLLGAYLSEEWSPDARHRLTLGVRGEADTWSGSAFLSPRMAWFQGLGDKDELTVAAGLYSQSDFPFNMRDANPRLEPEKAFHFNAEWTHHFSDHYRMEVQAYQKNYYDLAVPVLRNTGGIDWRGDLAWGLDSAAFESLPPEIREAILDRIGQKEIGYATGGIGKAGGLELSLFYDPVPAWSGWISAEAAYSKRKDYEDQPVYDYRYSRPWAFNWVNYFHMPSHYLLSLRARYAAGLPYSEFRSPSLPGAPPMGDTAFYLSPRNRARYAPYSRWDVRLAKDFRLGRHPMQFYTEVWNMFNSPNFIMRDGKTGQWKFWDANFPIPILFLGVNARW